MTLESSSNSVFSQVDALIRNKILNAKIDVPMLPEVAGKVVRLTQDPDSDAIELAHLIQSDQTLAGHVMKVANSAAYSPNSTMVSLQQAITRLGMRVISEIALAASINSTLFNTPGFEAHIHHELRYSLGAGLWAKEVARVCRKNVEAAFLAGLLHDIGRPVAIQSALESAAKLNATLSKSDVFTIERSYQRAIGVRVVEQWEMPALVIGVVKFYDNYSRPHKGQEQTQIVVAGSKFANHFLRANDHQDALTLEQLVEDPVLADLNLYQDDIEKVLQKEDVVNSAIEAMGS